MSSSSYSAPRYPPSKRQKAPPPSDGPDMSLELKRTLVTLDPDYMGNEPRANSADLLVVLRFVCRDNLHREIRRVLITPRYRSALGEDAIVELLCFCIQNNYTACAEVLAYHSPYLYDRYAFDFYTRIYTTGIDGSKDAFYRAVYAITHRAECAPNTKLGNHLRYLRPYHDFFQGLVGRVGLPRNDYTTFDGQYSGKARDEDEHNGRLIEPGVHCAASIPFSDILFLLSRSPFSAQCTNVSDLADIFDHPILSKDPFRYSLRAAESGRLFRLFFSGSTVFSALYNCYAAETLVSVVDSWRFAVPPAPPSNPEDKKAVEAHQCALAKFKSDTSIKVDSFDRLERLVQVYITRDIKSKESLALIETAAQQWTTFVCALADPVPVSAISQVLSNGNLVTNQFRLKALLLSRFRVKVDNGNASDVKPELRRVASFEGRRLNAGDTQGLIKHFYLCFPGCNSRLLFTTLLSYLYPFWFFKENAGLVVVPEEHQKYWNEIKHKQPVPQPIEEAKETEKKEEKQGEGKQEKQHAGHKRSGADVIEID